MKITFTSLSYFQKIAEKRDAEDEMTLAQKLEPYTPVLGHGDGSD